MKDVAKVFKLAKKYLEPVCYICWAIEDVKQTHPELKRACGTALRIIRTRMGVSFSKIDYYCLEDWLRDHHGIYAYNCPESERILYRKRWLDALIKEFDK